MHIKHKKAIDRKEKVRKKSQNKEADEKKK